jgi:molybdopterin-guanine dinucleotide biosynthesis protein
MINNKPFLIGIGGAHSAVGKTTLAAAIISHLAAHPLCRKSGRHEIGAIKYTRTSLYASLIEDESIIGEKNKDTEKLSTAGASKVLWIKSPHPDLEELVAIALARLSDLEVIVIEGNSAIEFAKPDIVIFIIGKHEEGIKPSAKGLLSEADIVIIPEASSSVPPTVKASAKIYARKDYPYTFDDDTIEDIITFMEDISRKNEIKRLLTERSVDARLTCTAARMIAEELHVPYVEVGRAANELKIKIKNCELGCF